MTNSNDKVFKIANWSEQKSRLKATFPILDYCDLQFEEDRNEEMLYHVQTKLGKTREELAAILAALSPRHQFFG